MHLLRRVVSLCRRLGSRLFPPEVRIGWGWTSREQRLLDRIRSDNWHKGMGEIGVSPECTLEITDGPNFFVQYKDLFLHQIYRFKSSRSDPLIIDAGANIGMSAIAFKRQYPAARILAFEPDSQIGEILRRNLKKFDLNDVRVIDAGLAATDGTLQFTPDASAGGQINHTGNVTIRVERLSKYLVEPVDFLKLNIEGMEEDVLREAARADTLKHVREMVIEYHGWANQPQRLGSILTLLDSQGFRYLVHDFDVETCPTTKPPFDRYPGATWFCLIHARRPEA